MCDNVNVLFDYGKERKRETSRGKQRRNNHIGVCDEQCENNGVSRPQNNKNFETFENFEEFHDQKLFQLHKLTAWEERCRDFSSNGALPLQHHKRHLGCAVENNGEHKHEGYIINDSLGSFSSPAGHTNGKSRHNETTNNVAQDRLASQSHASFKNQRRRERKSSLCTLTVLPPLAEEKYNSSPSPVISHHTIGDFGERDSFEVPAIILSKVEDEYRDTKNLKLPKIEPAVSTKSGHLQIPLSSSEPNRLAAPSFLEPFKAFRPPVQPRLADKSTIGNLRLPQLRTRNSTISVGDENEKGPEKPARLCWIDHDDES